VYFGLIQILVGALLRANSIWLIPGIIITLYIRHDSQTKTLVSLNISVGDHIDKRS